MLDWLGGRCAVLFEELDELFQARLAEPDFLDPPLVICYVEMRFAILGGRILEKPVARQVDEQGVQLGLRHIEDEAFLFGTWRLLGRRSDRQREQSAPSTVGV